MLPLDGPSRPFQDGGTRLLNLEIGHVDGV